MQCTNTGKCKNIWICPELTDRSRDRIDATNFSNIPSCKLLSDTHSFSFWKVLLSDDKIQIKYLHQRRKNLHLSHKTSEFRYSLFFSFLKMKNTKKCMNKRNTRNEKFYNNNIIIMIIHKRNVEQKILVHASHRSNRPHSPVEHGRGPKARNSPSSGSSARSPGGYSRR